MGDANVITINTFFGERSRGVDSVGVEKLPSPTDKASRRELRAARDYTELLISAIRIVDNNIAIC